MVDRDRQLDRLAAQQHGAFTRAQALSLGYTPGVIQRRRTSGAWLDLRHGTYALSSAPVTWERDVSAAVLSAGPSAAASHTTAARLWGLIDTDGPRIHVIVTHTAHHRTDRLVVVHRTRHPAQVRTVNGLRTTEPHRTVIDLASVVDTPLLEAALDSALLEGLVSNSSLMRRVGACGPLPGSAALRKLILDRASGVPESEFERKFERLLRKHRIPMPVRQYRVGSRRVDYAYLDLKIAIELDGLRDHARRTVFDDDRRRQNELVLAGWVVLRFTWDDVTKRDRDVARIIAQALKA